jgi:hypothetical protein
MLARASPTIDGYGNRIGKLVELGIAAVEIHFHAEPLAPIGYVICQRGRKPQLIDCRRSQFRRDAVNGSGDLFDFLAHLMQPSAVILAKPRFDATELH